MSEKLQKLLDQIYNENLRKIDTSLSLEEVLSKDGNGITFLEHLLKNKVDFNYINSLFTSLEAASVFLKCHQRIDFFKLSEEQLFTKINGELFVKSIINEDKITLSMVRKIKSHFEIIDLLGSNYIDYINYISSELLQNLLSINCKTGEYNIKKYFNKNRIIKKIIYLINDPKLIISLCTKYNRNDLLLEVNEKALMNKVNENATLLEYLINKNVIPKVLKNGTNDYEFINYLRNKNLYQYLINFDETILLNKYDNDKTLLEEIIEKGYLLERTDKLNDKRSIKILFDTGKLLKTSFLGENILAVSLSEILNDSNFGNQMLLEYMLNNGHNPLKNEFCILRDDIIDIFLKRKDYEFLSEKLLESELKIEVNGVTIYEQLLQNGVSLKSSIYSLEIMKKVIEYNDFKSLLMCDVSLLFNMPTSSETYMDCVLQAVKEKKIKGNLNNLINHCTSQNTLAKLYITIAKKDMMTYINKITEKQLLKNKNGKTLLEELLDLDSELTLQKIITSNVKSNIKIASILNSRGLEQEIIDIPFEEQNFKEEYIKNYKNNIGVGPVFVEGEQLLKELEDLFINDGISDKDLIESLITGYRQGLIVNYELNLQELKNLIHIKKNNINFAYIFCNESKACFSSEDKNVHCCNSAVDVVMHETGHALHYFLTKNFVPNEYANIIDGLRKNPNILKNAEMISNEYNDLIEKVTETVSKKLDAFFETYYTDEKREKIKKHLQKLKNDQRKELINFGISENVINKIINTNFTEDEYIYQKNMIFKKEYISAILYNNYYARMAMSDILDAIFDGELHSGMLKNNCGELISSAPGHGVSYYYDNKPQFSEMIANFSMFVKNKDSEILLNKLKSLTGNELFNLISEFYYDSISKEKEVALSKIRRV